MNNIFNSNITKGLEDKVEKDFIMGLCKASYSTSRKITVDEIISLDDALTLDKNKKIDHIKTVLSL
jgi:hypothetical protein